MKGKPTHASCSWISLTPLEDLKDFKGDLKSPSDLIELLKHWALKQAQSIV